ncbi:heme oxygenase (biliverdin-producing) [Streptomyces sp. NPDC006879]|uniref:biliverdin-producing heme oxygenase n=1 Tax=Streptomyces sp. NPDC006879 TaxID=3364767 RepID=UPI0036986DD4
MDAFSRAIREASQEQHSRAANTGFMPDLLGGRLGVEAYARYTEQLWFVYRALEGASAVLQDDPVAGPFIQPELMRVAALEDDLAHLLGPHWRKDARPLPSTDAYAQRVTRCAHSWPGGYVAHHYTRYLGDLSGGQVIRDRVERFWGFAPKGDGVRFYVFAEVTSPTAFKRRYRELLDAIPADDLERKRIIDECRRAFAMNGAVFRELGEQFPRSA